MLAKTHTIKTMPFQILTFQYKLQTGLRRKYCRKVVCYVIAPSVN